MDLEYGRKTARLNCYMTQELSNRIDDYCKKSNVTKSAFVAMALSTFLDSLEMSQDVVYNLLREVVQKEVSKADVESALKEVIYEEVNKDADKK